MNVGQDKWLSPAQAARELGLTPARVRQLMDAGHLRHERTPIGRFIDADAVRVLRRERAQKAGSSVGGDDA